jgi:hypothetical protein
MLKGPDPMRALYLLYSMQLWGVVFRLPPMEDVHRADVVGGATVTSDAAASLPPEGVATMGLHVALLVHRLAADGVPTHALAATAPRRCLLWWGGVLLPLAHLHTKFKKASTQSLVEYMFRESLRGLPLQEV